MDPRLLEYYNRELQFVREMGAEFARTYPRIAARLGVDGIECADPYIERLLEGFAFLAARVQLKIDARHPEFTQHLLEMVYPDFLNPVPSCAMAEFVPELKDAALEAGLTIPRGSSLRTVLGKGERTACEFRTAQDVTLWPLRISEVKYMTGSGAVSAQGIAVDARTRAAIRLRFKVSPGIKLSSLPLKSLRIFIKAPPDIAYKVHEQAIANCLGFYVRSCEPGAQVHFRSARSVAQVGLDEDESRLPVTRTGFQGYRLLQEYFAFSDRFLFFALNDLDGLCAGFQGDEFEIFLALDRVQNSLENTLDPGHFRLFATPVVNLFPRELDRMHLTPYETEHHVVPDRNRPMDFEVYSVLHAAALGAGGDKLVELAPFYTANHRTANDDERAYYTLQRRQRSVLEPPGAGRGAHQLHRHRVLFVHHRLAAAGMERRDTPIGHPSLVHQSRPAHSSFHGQGSHGFPARRGGAAGGDPLHLRSHLSAALAGVRRYGVASHQPFDAQLPVAAGYQSR